MPNTELFQECNGVIPNDTLHLLAKLPTGNCVLMYYV